MEPEIRTLRKEDLEAAFRLDQQAFNLPEWRREHWLRWCRPERGHGAFVQGALAAACHVWSFGQFFGGRSVPMGGVGGVAVAPEHRGRGLAKAVVSHALAAMRERGEVISALYPATTSLYRSLGWELAGAAVWHHISPRELRDVRAPASLAVRRVETTADDDFVPLRRCYERLAPQIDGWLDRGDHRWGALREWWAHGHYVYACTGAQGEVEAYLAYRHEPAPPDTGGDYAIRVDELVATTPGGLRAAWWTLASSASQVNAISFTASPEDALLLVMPEQRNVVRGQVRWMLRLVDAPAAVAARGFAPGLEVTVPLELSDERVPDNAGAWTLAVAKGEGRLERGGRGGPRLGIGAFSSLYSGWATAGVLARAGLLGGGSDGQRRALDAAFAGPTPWMMDEF